MNAREALLAAGVAEPVRGYGHATAEEVLDALRAAAGGAERVVLCWDGDECTLRGLAPMGWEWDADGYGAVLNFAGTPECAIEAPDDPDDLPLFVLTDVAVTSPEEES